MCGIAGCVTTHDAVPEGVVDRQLLQLLHRGPDSLGTYARGRGAVGQTRLAVIDLVTGDPPITDEDGAIGVALNGEIYNFLALHEELRAEGHHLRTRGDTEVIAHLAERLEPAALARRLHGMFAFAVWDSRRGRLILGRDRLGKKPLYYWHGVGTFVFGTEIKAVLAHPAVPRQLNRRAIPAYLGYGYVPTPETFFDGVCSVRPGHVLVLEADGSLRLEEFWRAPVAGLDGASHLDVSLADAGAEVRRLLGQAVERRLISDVPLGAFLSGGIDSSAVVALMAAASDRPVQTFTIGFDDDEGFDERPFARLVAERLGTDHHEFVVKPDTVELVERIVWHCDQPFGDSSALPTYLLSQITRQHVTVALSGDGADEVFAGYDRFQAALAVGALARVPGAMRPVASAARAATRLLGGSRARLAQRFLGNVDRGLPDAYIAWVQFILDDDRLRALVPDDDTGWAAADLRRVWGESDGAATLDRILDLNRRTYLVDDLLPKADRMSMAHALEVRSPFLDHELVDYAALLPPALKVRRRTNKVVLREAVGNLLPPEVLARRKKGFGVPLDKWFRGDLRSFAEASLGPGARVRDHLDGAALDLIMAEHQRGDRGHGHALWALVLLEEFLSRQGW